MLERIKKNYYLTIIHPVIGSVTYFVSGSCLYVLYCTVIQYNLGKRMFSFRFLPSNKFSCNFVYIVSPEDSKFVAKRAGFKQPKHILKANYYLFV